MVDGRSTTWGYFRQTGKKAYKKIILKPAIPADKIKPRLRIDSPRGGAVVSDKVRIRVSAWDGDSRNRKVVFKIGNKRIAQDKKRSFAATWDTAGYGPGEHRIGAVAIDDAGNRRVRSVLVTLSGGTAVEGEGTIFSLGEGLLEVSGRRLNITDGTSIMFNDVSRYAVGVPVQHKGLQDSSGAITLTLLEVNRFFAQRAGCAPPRSSFVSRANAVEPHSAFRAFGRIVLPPGWPESRCRRYYPAGEKRPAVSGRTDC